MADLIVMSEMTWAQVDEAMKDRPVGILPVGGEMFQTIIVVCGAIFIVLGIIELLGGIMALRRKMWALALVGSILGLFTFGFYGISSILSLVALIILAISRKEF